MKKMVGEIWETNTGNKVGKKVQTNFVTKLGVKVSKKQVREKKSGEKVEKKVGEKNLWGKK